jgi:membrane-associated phospholipid phosphatase
MFLLAAILLASVVLTLGVGMAFHRLVPERWGGPLRWGRSLARRMGSVSALAVVVVVGFIATFLVMLPIGLLAKSLQSAVDIPIFTWTRDLVHSGSVFTKINNYVTTLGDRSTIDLVCVIAALILAFAYGRRWWIPVVAIGVTFFAQHEGQLLLARLLARDLPPVAHRGAFPSGGVSRLLADYGVVIVLVILLIGTVSRHWRVGLWVGLGTFAIIESFTRGYLPLHWFTDLLAGYAFGWLLFLTFATAVAALETRTSVFSGERHTGLETQRRRALGVLPTPLPG